MSFKALISLPDMMTLCLTFDDGLKTHATIAGPMLAARGWSGAFCIPTALMGLDKDLLTREQVQDLCLEGHEDNLMTWDDACRMMADGHELCPHTHDHVDLVDLYNAGRLAEIERQISLGKEVFKAKTGRCPEFFCLPHYSTCPYVNRRIRAHRMEVFNCGRANFGGAYQKGRITEFLSARAKSGWLHVDISVHGISKATGGWEPFDATEDFVAFLDEIKDAENLGVVKVVPYSSVHRRYSCISKYLSLLDRIVNRMHVWITSR